MNQFSRPARPVDTVPRTGTTHSGGQHSGGSRLAGDSHTHASGAESRGGKTLRFDSGPPVENVVQRLRRRMRDAESLGCDVRLEWLNESQSDWCTIGGRRVVFLDSAQTAAEQLVQLEEILSQIFPGLMPRS